MNTKRWLALALSLALSVSASFSAHAESVLKIGRNVDSNTFDPIMTQENADIWPDLNIHSSLLRVSKDGTSVEPALAESWTTSDDGKIWTFKLRDNLKFGDGSPLTAMDAKFSMLRARDTKESPWAWMFSNIANITATDQSTVVFELKQPSAVFLASLAWFDASIIPETYFNKVGADEFGRKPVGAGAYNLTEWRRGDRLIMTKNPHYWESGKPMIDRVEWIKIADDAARILALQAGEIDVTSVPFNRVEELSRDLALEARLLPSSFANEWILNHAVKPLDNVKVRQALYKGLDREAITRIVTFGAGEVSQSIIPCGGMFWNKDNKGYAYDPEGAKALLAEAGVSDLKIELISAAGNETGEQIAVLIKDQLAKVGVEIEIKRIEANLMWDTLVNREFESGLYFWTNDIIDPDEKLTFAVAGDKANQSWYSGYKNPKVSELVEAGRLELDLEKRKKIYFDIQRIEMEDAPYIHLYCAPYTLVSSKKVRDLHQDPLGKMWLEDVTFAQ